MKPVAILLFLVLLFYSDTGYCQDEHKTIGFPSFDSLSFRSHPRLLLTNYRMLELKQKMTTDPELKKYITDVLENARKDEGRVLDYNLLKINPSAIAKECLSRIYLMSFAFRWTGDERYAKRARAEMVGGCSLADWKTSRFIEVSELTHAMALGYDWLYDWLDSTSRKMIRDGIIRNGLEPGRLAYMDPANNQGWWIKSDGKSNLICNSGLIIGCLSVADTNPEYAKIILPAAIQSLPRAILKLGQTGGGSDGYTSWSASVFHFSCGLSALQSSLGTMYSLDKVINLKPAGLFPIFTSSPSELVLCYADQGERMHRIPCGALFWLAEINQLPLLSENEHHFILKHPATVNHIVWYQSRMKTSPYPLEKSYLFNGETPILTMRSAWNNPDGWFVGIKAGTNKNTHGHADLGNFELDAGGVRWFRDLGAEDFDIPDYFNNSDPQIRQAYFRVSSYSHNVPVINHLNQEMNTTSRFVNWKTDSVAPFGIIDLSEAYCNSAKTVFRGIRLFGTTGVLIQDEFSFRDSSEILWGLTTDALVYIKDDHTAVLKSGGKVLYVKLINPAHAFFQVTSAARKLPEKENTGVSRLEIHILKTGPKETITVMVSMNPITTEMRDFSKSLIQWN